MFVLANIPMLIYTIITEQLGRNEVNSKCMSHTITVLTFVNSAGATAMHRWYAEHLAWLGASLLDMDTLAKGQVSSGLTKWAAMGQKRA